MKKPIFERPLRDQKRSIELKKLNDALARGKSLASATEPAPDKSQRKEND